MILPHSSQLLPILGNYELAVLYQLAAERKKKCIGITGNLLLLGYVLGQWFYHEQSLHKEPQCSSITTKSLHFKSVDNHSNTYDIYLQHIP